MADAMTSGALRPVHVHPSRLELAIWLAGDASEAQDEALVQHVETCRSCSAALDELRQHKSEYERSSPAELAKLRTRMGLVAGETSVWHRFVVGLAALRLATSLVALALVGVLVFVVASRLSRPPAREAARGAGALGPRRAALAPADDGRDDLRTKGSALALRVVVRRDGKRFELPLGRGVAAGSGARGAELPRLRAGDALRFVVTVGRRGYLAVFSVDGRRQVTSFYPQTSDDPALSKKPLRLARAGKHVLPGSVVLDDAPGREHVVVVFGLRAFDRAALARRAARLILSGQALTAQALGVDAIARLSFDRDREGPTE